MKLPESVELIEVCPRDGFQNVHDLIPFDAKVAIIKKLAEAGFKRIEAVSFVSPKAIPQMADAKDVMLAVKDTLKAHGVRSVALVPNARGVETALECGVDELTSAAPPTSPWPSSRSWPENTAIRCASAWPWPPPWAAPSARRSARSGWRRWCASAWTRAARRS